MFPELIWRQHGDVTLGVAPTMWLRQILREAPVVWGFGGPRYQLQQCYIVVFPQERYGERVWMDVQTATEDDT